MFFAGTDKVWEQDTFGPAAPAWTTAAARPAFSPTGRLVAAVEQVSGVWSVTVRQASNGVLQWSVPAPPARCSTNRRSRPMASAS